MRLCSLAVGETSRVLLQHRHAKFRSRRDVVYLHTAVQENIVVEHLKLIEIRKLILRNQCRRRRRIGSRPNCTDKKNCVLRIDVIRILSTNQKSNITNHQNNANYIANNTKPSIITSSAAATVRMKAFVKTVCFNRNHASRNKTKTTSATESTTTTMKSTSKSTYIYIIEKGIEK
jgi:hypothetical protein